MMKWSRRLKNLNAIFLTLIVLYLEINNLVADLRSLKEAILELIHYPLCSPRLVLPDIHVFP
jgi:hypothetical protein